MRNLGGKGGGRKYIGGEKSTREHVSNPIVIEKRDEKREPGIIKGGGKKFSGGETSRTKKSIRGRGSATSGTIIHIKRVL